jgi:hypothetical protein
MRFNADSTAANYTSIRGFWYHSGLFGTAQQLAGSASGIILFDATAAGAPAGYFGFLTIDIYNYAETSRPRIVKSTAYAQLNTTTGNLFMFAGGGLWLNTSSAITSITLLPNSGNDWLAGSGYALYGIG